MLRIKELIKARGYTQKEFADKIGMSAVGLSQLVNGKPSYPTLEKFALALDVPIWQLFVSPEDAAGVDQGSDFCAFIRWKGIHYTADSESEFWKIVDELKTISGRKID